MTKPTIALLGLGIMGRPMLRVLLNAGYPARGWNRSPLAAELAGDLPQYSSLTQATAADIIILMLANPTAVAEVLHQIEPLLRSGQLLIDMGTSDPDTSRATAERLAQQGIGWVDAPVSGGPEGAAAATLAIMAGATTADFERAAPILQTFAGNLVRVGEPGAGHTTKLINQLICALAIQAVAEGLLLAERSGLDPRLVQQALRGGLADSKVLHIHGSRMIERAYIPGGRAAIHLKDLRLIKAQADAVGLSLPHMESVLARYAQIVAHGDGDLDHSALHKLLLAEQENHDAHSAG